MLDPRKPPATLAEMAQRSFVQNVSRPFLGSKAKGATEYTYATYGAIALRVRETAGGLIALGLERGDRVGILSENRPEWAIADLACQMSGMVTVPFYSTLPANQIAVILRDSGAKLVFVSSEAQLKKIQEVRQELPDLQFVVTFDAVESEGVQQLTALETQGRAHWEKNPGGYETLWIATLPNDTATIIYTSGTTGEPKGVMLSHRNLLSNIEQFTIAVSLSSEDSFLSFLPLAHVYERTAGYYLPTWLGASIAYCESLFTVDKNLREVNPTFMLSVPRLYESIHEKLFSTASSLPENQREKYLDALALAKKAGAHKGGLPDSPALGLMEKIKYKLYDIKVYSKIREKFGSRLRFFVAGGAPLPPQLGALFLGMNIVILEGYGLTETSPVIAVNRPENVRLGTVGKVLENLEVKIAEDGEICVRGASVMKGYWNKEEATGEIVTSDGWLLTGDIGELKNGILKITDRKKDLLVLANGKNVAPAPIEMSLSQSEYIQQVVLLGDKLKAVGALIIPHFENLKKWAKEQKIEGDDPKQLVADAAVNKLLKSEIEKYSTGLADFERVKKVVLLAEPFSVENGEMTPTLKIKRRVVAQKYGNLLGGE